MAKKRHLNAEMRPADAGQTQKRRELFPDAFGVGFADARVVAADRVSRFGVDGKSRVRLKAGER
jgi:hypothetical protein